MSLSQAYVQIYTGEGKGKTTASLGLCFRALGAGLRPVIFQFIKQRRCSEHLLAEKLNLSIYQAKGNLDLEVANKELYYSILQALRSQDYDLVVVDELGEALRRSYLSRKEVENLVAARPQNCELVFTGRGLIGQIDDLADLVSDIRPHKHYFNEGVIAREGIEY